MVLAVFIGVVCFFIAALSFDISFNIRRLNNNSDRIWRKLVEIEDALRKK